MTVERSYTIVLWPEPEGGFTVRVPAMAEIVSYGTDEGEALEMAREAVEVAIEVRLDEAVPIPEDVAPLTRSVIVEIPD